MREETNYNGNKIVCEFGYVPVKDIETLVLSLDPNVGVHSGSIVRNLKQYILNIDSEGNNCHLELAINYVLVEVSRLVAIGDIDSSETQEQELYSASYSAHSKNSSYLDATLSSLKERLGWIYIKKENPLLKMPIQFALQAHKDNIDMLSQMD